MALAQAEGIEGLKELIGQEVGPSEWRTVTQEDIDAFAELTGDDQWIHVDVERAKKESPFGTTVAHGNLTLSLIDGFRVGMIESSGFALGVNYGWNKVRFPAPVPAGSRVRARAEVVSVDEAGGGLVADRHPLHARGRGLGQALLRGRQRRPRPARLTAEATAPAARPVSAPYLTVRCRPCRLPCGPARCRSTRRCPASGRPSPRCCPVRQVGGLLDAVARDLDVMGDRGGVVERHGDRVRAFAVSVVGDQESWPVGSALTTSVVPPPPPPPAAPPPPPPPTTAGWRARRRGGVTGAVVVATAAGDQSDPPRR
jgi:acyl dehydratase